MRIHIGGDSAAARTLRGYIESQGYTLSETAPAYALHIEEGVQANVVLKGVRGALADEAQHAIAELAGVPVEWQRADAGSERELHIVTGSASADAVERGLLRAILRLTGPQGRSGWLKKLWSQQ